MSQQVMVDLETLGTDPGVAIVSIGAVRFDIADGVTSELQRSVDLASCQDVGLKIDAGTLEWWLGQSADARAQLQGGETLEDALRAFTRFIGAHDGGVWANSPAFDCVILRCAYDAVGWDCPWAYYQERDYRTLRETLDCWPDRDQSGTDHDALDDARYQAECLVAALRRLDGDD
jgi:hypothetical protein